MGAELKDFHWFHALDPVRQGVIIQIGIQRLTPAMRSAMTYGNWVGAAFEIWNSHQLNRDMGPACCKDLANALEYGISQNS